MDKGRLGGHERENGHNDGGHGEHEEDKEANAVAIAATSVVAKVNPTSPSGLNQMNHPTLDMVGKDLGSRDGLHDVQNPNNHAFPPQGLPPNYTPPNVAYTLNENLNNSTPILIENQ